MVLGHIWSGFSACEWFKRELVVYLRMSGFSALTGFSVCEVVIGHIISGTSACKRF